MKAIYIVVLTLLCFPSLAQYTYAPIGATWHYDKVENFAEEKGYVLVTSERDTLINEKESRILSQVYVNSDGVEQQRENLYVHQTGDSVYFWINEEFRLFYDFSLEVNDTMEIYSPEELCSGEYIGHIKLDSITLIDINGVSLRKFHTSRLPGSPYMYSGPFVEVLGMTGWSFYPQDTGCIQDQLPSIGSLRCYSDLLLDDYSAAPGIPCDTTIKYVDLPEDKVDGIDPFDIYFDPSERTLIIKSPAEKRVDNLWLSVYDTKGLCLVHERLNEESYHLNMSGFPRGLFIVNILQSSKIIFNHKIFAF